MDAIEKRTRILLMNIGVPAHLSGYEFLVEAVRMSYENKDLLNSVTKTLYPKIGEKFGKTKFCVERNMRHAIEKISSINPDCIKKLCVVIPEYNKETFTVSHFIAVCVEILRLEELD